MVGTDTLPDVLCLYFDGSCYYNETPKKAYFGWTIQTEDGAEVAADSGEACMGDSANQNVAELHGLLSALRWLREKGWRGRLRIFGDAKSLINILTRTKRRCRKQYLTDYRLACTDLLSRWIWTMDWVPRAENRRANSLARQIRKQKLQIKAFP